MESLTERLAQAAGLISRSGGAVALTGAGVSTESGIPDFRGQSGLWSRFDPRFPGRGLAMKLVEEHLRP